MSPQGIRDAHQYLCCTQYAVERMDPDHIVRDCRRRGEKRIKVRDYLLYQMVREGIHRNVLADYSGLSASTIYQIARQHGAWGTYPLISTAEDIARYKADYPKLERLTEEDVQDHYLRGCFPILWRAGA